MKYLTRYTINFLQVCYLHTARISSSNMEISDVNRCRFGAFKYNFLKYEILHVYYLLNAENSARQFSLKFNIETETFFKSLPVFEVSE